ncbi:MAG: transposase [Chloroflexi bacterium]|nr:transposase [Chloroflexota bacterium]
MMNSQLLYQWETALSAHLPCLNSWQRANAALFRYGIVSAESCQQGAVARQVSCGEQVENTARRWRRWLDNDALELERFFREWSRWVAESVGSRKVTLLVDETKLHDRVGVMMVGLAWAGRCLPLAWRTYEANKAQAYPVEGQVALIRGLLEQVKSGLGEQRQVLVLADRGIGCSPALCRAVAELGWQYLFRVSCQTKVVTDTEDYTIAQQVQPGEIWAQSGRVFKQRGRIPARARALWAVGYDEPWALVTNDDGLTGHEYARRNWQEQSFRDLKSGGWHWGDSRIRLPQHVAHLLILLALAYTWMVALGSQAVAQGCAQPLVRRPNGTFRRLWSLFREGLRYFVQFVQRHTVCLGLVFIPDRRLI